MKKTIFTLVLVSISMTLFSLDTDPLLKNAPVKIRERQKKAARPDIPGHVMFEFGVNLLQDEPIPMQNSVFGSRTVNIYYTYELPLGNSGIYFVPGLGLGLDRYKFKNDFTVTQDSDGTVEFTDITTLDPRKSMLVANYFDIPLEFRYFFNRDNPRQSFHISVGGKIGVLFSSHTKIKFDDGVEMAKVKDHRTYGLNMFRYGVTGRIGYGGVNIYGYYSLSELFETGPDGTLDTSNIQIGLSFNLF